MGATVGGYAADVLFVGQAPVLVAGVVQVNVRIPPNVLSRNVDLIVYAGDYRTQISRLFIVVQ